ncbi:CBS domain-containing protein [Novosphingobium mangrovi (ex Hu et al. 2023)]|uniref:CBS domain-containing protein n=1 Tax=Novosphingobium mangrovi (ex Hu et al. 2023) TaxID=2930094 RepID=A0ABT0AB14_9SPHN|nr:CBS domain-containing protein [Novosphingobium mangrovi (ex Hu et al. 2023)]MCJ1960390.1 CBS domain-containing protein [Novosphingobium mangrovi (ex Hu et al. 2023)]
MTIERIIESRHDIVTCPASATVREAAGLLAERRIGAMPVMDGDSIAGIFSERDVLYRLREFGAELLDKPVREVMTAPAVTVDPTTSAMTALAMMTKRRIRHLPVVEGGRMVGFVSIGDIVKYRIDKVEGEAAALRDYIQMA